MSSNLSPEGHHSSGVFFIESSAILEDYLKSAVQLERILSFSLIGYLLVKLYWFSILIGQSAVPIDWLYLMSSMIGCQIEGLIEQVFRHESSCQDGMVKISFFSSSFFSDNFM